MRIDRVGMDATVQPGETSGVWRRFDWIGRAGRNRFRPLDRVIDPGRSMRGMREGTTRARESAAFTHASLSGP